MKERDVIAVVVIILLLILGSVLFCVVKYRDLLARAMDSSGGRSKSSHVSSKV